MAASLAANKASGEQRHRQYILRSTTPIHVRGALAGYLASPALDAYASHSASVTRCQLHVLMQVVLPFPPSTDPG